MSPSSSVRRALVVDEEAVVSMLIEEALIQHGYSVTVANNATTLAEALELKWYELAITDTNLASYGEIQKWNVDRVIICSGKDESYIHENYPGLELLPKPFLEEELAGIL